MVEVPGTAPGSAVATSCVLYRHSQQADSLYIGGLNDFLKSFRGVGENKFTGSSRFYAILSVGVDLSFGAITLIF